MQICIFVLSHPNKNYISLDSQKRMLYNDLNYVNVGNQIDAPHRNLKNCNFQYFF